MRKSGVRAWIPALFIFLLCACEQDASQQSLAREAFLQKRDAVLAEFGPCDRDAGTVLATLVAESLCTVFSVPENYDDPQGRQVDLKLMVIPALSDFPESDPLFLLAGGPGQAATDLVQAAQVFSRTRTERDIVLLDQRGTGELSPFDCQLSEEETEALERRDPPFEEVLTIQLDVLRKCLSETQADPAYYTTDIAMRDLDQVRDTLGYSQINLWGASYGSRAALAYLRGYPEHTRTVIIDAIAPTALKLPLYNERDVSASLEAVMNDCAQSRECHAAFPALRDHYLELLEHLQTPQPLTYVDYSDYSRLDISLDAYEFQGFLRQVLYSREAQRLLPLIIEQAWEGNYEPVFALAGQYAQAQINQGMFLSVICNEDVTFISKDELEAENASSYLIKSDMFNRFVLEACAFWPVREIPDDYFEPVIENKPVLIFSGALDPVTPPVWGELVHDALPNSEHYVLEGFGHGTLFTTCTSAMMNTFIETASFEALDSNCIETFVRRPFFVTPGGSRMPDD